MSNKKKSFWIYSAFLFFILLGIVKWITYENLAKKNVKNCDLIKLDMTIDQVVKIMGKPNKVKTYQGKIDYTDIEITKYYYNAPSGSSVGVNIVFNARTGKVISTECKD